MIYKYVSHPFTPPHPPTKKKDPCYLEGGPPQALTPGRQAPVRESMQMFTYHT